MNEISEFKIELEKLKKENDELRKKLESRDIPFNKQLMSRVDSKYFELTFNVGHAIFQSAGSDMINFLKNKELFIDYMHSSYGRSGYYIKLINDKDVKVVKQYMAELELRKFQESLDNFSWAVQNQVSNILEIAKNEKAEEAIIVLKIGDNYKILMAANPLTACYMSKAIDSHITTAFFTSHKIEQVKGNELN